MTSAITVENLSKAYRIGLKETIPDTLAGAATSWLRAPLNNLKNLSRLNTFSTEDGEEDVHWALKDVSFDVAHGDAIGIIGHNGAGKSTLLKILSRITKPTSGRAVIRGRVSSLLEVGTGFHPELSGRENIYMNGTILGMRKAEIDHKFDEIVAFSGVEKFLDTPIKRYSSGMKVRLAFAVAAHLEPEILVIDEVLAVGDLEFQEKCLGKMKSVSSSGRTVLFVSHNMGAVREFCNRSILLKGGKVKYSGKTHIALNEYLGASAREVDGGFVRQDDQSTADQSFRVSKVVVSSSTAEAPRQQFDCDEALDIRAWFNARKPVRGMYGYMSIQKTDGTLVLESDSCDANTNPFDGPISSNFDSFFIRIPPRLLGPGEYLINLSFHSSSYHLGFDVDRVGVVGRFQLVDTATNRGNRRRGHLSARLNWTMDEGN